MELMLEDYHKDMLSGLPDDILLHILSFLRLKDAAKTALLQRFGSLWRGIPFLDFDQCSYHICHKGPYRNEQFINLIRQVIKLKASPTLQKLRLRFHFHQGHDGMLLEDCAAEINSLIHYALSRKVKVLELDLLGCGLFELVEDYTLPDAVLRSDCLTELSLAYCDIQYQGEINLKALKTLSLNGVELNDEQMEKIVVGCPSLEDLTIISCSFLTKLDCSRNPNFRKLNLVLHMGQALTVSCPEIVSVKIAGCVERARFI